MRWDIPALHYYVAFAGKTIPCAKYASYGTQELADNAFEGMGEGKAALLANHGLITIGRSVKEAFLVAEMSEEMAEYYYRTQSIGEPVLLDEEEMESMLLRFKSYGQ